MLQQDSVTGITLQSNGPTSDDIVAAQAQMLDVVAKELYRHKMLQLTKQRHKTGMGVLVFRPGWRLSADIRVTSPAFAQIATLLGKPVKLLAACAPHALTLTLTLNPTQM